MPFSRKNIMPPHGALNAILAGLLSVVLIAAMHSPACADTLWAAAGSPVEGGGVLVAKNHDDRLLPTELRLVAPRKGFTYLGLFSMGSPTLHGPLAGVNEKGLAVVTAVPETLPPGPGPNPSMERIADSLLTSYESVDRIIADQRILKQGPPAFYLIADNTRIALVETAPHGGISVISLTDGILAHTNHYTDERFLALNRQAAKGSEPRLERITRLLKSSTVPFTQDAFTALSHDRGAGRDDDILRVRQSPDTHQVRTLATWVLFIPAAKPAELHVGIFGPDGGETEYDFKLDKPFWTEGLR